MNFLNVDEESNELLRLKIKDIFTELKNTLKYLPVELHKDKDIVSIGFNSFQVPGIPYFSIKPKGFILEAIQSSTSFSKSSAKQYAEALLEFHDQYDFIKKCLDELDSLNAQIIR